MAAAGCKLVCSSLPSLHISKPFLQKLQCCDLLHLPHSCNLHMKKHCGGVNVFYCSSF
jgi:hypothetical protein